MTKRVRTSATRRGQKTMMKFLDAAAEEFNNHGYEGTTIRAIAKRAQVNLGTLHHYWGSKKELFRELFEIQFLPLRQERLRRLHAAGSLVKPGTPPSATHVLRAIMEPILDSGDGRAGRRRFHALYARAAMDPSPEVIGAMVKIFDEPVQLFISLMRMACPEVSAAEMDWRVNCIIGAQIFAELYRERGRRFFGAEADVDENVSSGWILHFLMHGLDAAPCPGIEKKPRTGKLAATVRRQRKA